ncbi:MAG: hypothetical protein QXK08_01610, partial [Candidatus Woesearchaeota archaeon]
MAFIHKNVNNALMLVIAFLSVALTATTVYSIGVFTDINDAYAEQAMRADELQRQLAEKEAMTDSLKQAAQLTQEREAALATILEKQRQEAQQQAVSAQATVAATNTAVKTQTAKASV